jgi:pimeloyl-ACP methyl ester carboxylesterase
MMGWAGRRKGAAPPIRSRRARIRRKIYRATAKDASDFHEVGPVLRKTLPSHLKKTINATKEIAMNEPNIQTDSEPMADCEIAPGESDNFKTAAFRMRLPQTSAPLRGTLLVVPGFNHDGRDAVDNPFWRGLAARWRLALVSAWWVAVYPPGGTKTQPHRHYANTPGGSGKAFWSALGQMAERLGRPELGRGPVVVWGHSAGGQFAHSLACAWPERVVAFAAIKGGYYFTEPQAGEIAHVPGLLIAGGKDEAFRFEAIRRVFEKGRSLNAPWARAVEPEAGHGVERSNDLAIPHLEAALGLRLGDDGVLKKIDPADGWMGDLETKRVQPSSAPIEPPERFCWFINQDLAEKWRNFCGDFPLNQFPVLDKENHP